MISLIETVRDEGDSVGGVIECVARGIPPGLGEPVFDKLEADLAKAMLSIPAAKAFEIGSGFGATQMRGSQHNDAFETRAGKIRTTTNNSGGVQGGISNGEDIYFRVAFKPPATIALKQKTVTISKDETDLAVRGRHDPCVLPRAVSSTGTLLAGALRYCREQTKPKRVVTLVPDTGNKYLSKMFNDFWMAEQGFIHRPPHGDLSDLISHRYEAGEVITVGPDDSLLTAFKRMRDSDVSQLPVVDKSGRAVGIIDESDLLVKVHREPSHFNDPVRKAMTDQLETLPPDAKIADLLGVFDRGRVAIVMDDNKFLGLITRTDLLSYLRLHMPKSSAPPEREFV
jgi:CBS domain-containing protein